MATRTIVPLNGVSIYGGFGDGFATRTNNKSSLTSTASPALRVAGFDSETRIDGLSVTVTARAQASEESVGLIVADSGDFLRFELDLYRELRRGWDRWSRRR